MFFTILGYVFIVLMIFTIGVMRGEQMEHDRIEKLADSDKPIYVDGDAETYAVKRSRYEAED